MPAVKFTVTLSGAVAGDQAAWYMLAQTGCDVEAGYIYSADAGQSVLEGAAIAKVFSQECPASCKLDDVDQTQAESGTTETTTNISALLQTHPNVKYVVSNAPGDPEYLVQAVRVLGKLGKVGVITEGDSPYEATAIQNSKSGYTANSSSPSFTFQGWLGADAALRVLEGATGTQAIPERWVEAGTAAATAPFLPDATYEQQLVKVWNAS